MLKLASGLSLLPWLLLDVSGAAIGVEKPFAELSSAEASTQFDLPPSSTLSFSASSSSSLFVASSTLAASSASGSATSTGASSFLSTDATSATVSSTLLSSTLSPPSSTATGLSSSSPVISGPVSATTTSPSQPTQSVDPSTLQDIAKARERRLALIISGISSTNSVSAWVSTLGDDGKWPDSEVDYTTGCMARRANWPAEEHWSRIVNMAAAWHGGVENGSTEFVNSSSLLDAIHRAMDYWFSNDFKVPDCLDSGGLPSCPCGTPGFWNTNWFANMIGTPELVGESCLLVGVDSLSPTQISNCTNFMTRTFATLGHKVNGLGIATGANTLDIAKIGIDSGLLINNASIIAEGYKRIHDEVVVQTAVAADGIRPDGSFGQHGGIIYNGNYGKDYANDVLALEIAAAGTQYSAKNTSIGSQAAFESLMQGDLWMIYRNVRTNVLHWDFSVINRFISFPVSDDQATGSIKINITEIQELGQLWDSEPLQSVYQTLSQGSNDANAGGINGNRMFYANDYMVQRGSGYVTTLNMYSTRTKNGECTNTQNPLGFHLSDGTVYTYLQGNEYEDIAAAWDWNLIPGITNDYDATPLSCDHEQFKGIESFVGGASTGQIGAAAMRYTNPYTRSLKFQKAWFFLDNDVQHVMISSINSSTLNPVVSVLEQKRLNGPIYVDGFPITQSSNFSQVHSLWHDNVGYTFQQQGFFDPGLDLTVDFGPRTGDWATIGISTVGEIIVDLFSAWLNHGSGSDLDVPTAYTVFPAVSQGEFLRKSITTKLVPIRNDANVSAVYDAAHKTAMFVFWSAAGGEATFTPSLLGPTITVGANANAVAIYKVDEGTLTVSDPSQKLSTVQFTVKKGFWGWSRDKVVDVALPTGATAGSSVSVKV
ncbi:galactose mutarotase-like protein [Trametes polyzona]|nr:galactose mutarotase-like protein [Trametes polyzona]